MGGLDADVHRGREGFLGRGRREAVVFGDAGEPFSMSPPWRRTRYPAAASPTSSLTPCVGRSGRGRPRPRSELPPSRDLQLNSAQKVALSLFSFLSGFKEASKFLHSQILAGAARKPGQQQVRAVSVPTTQPVLLLFCG